MLKKLLLVLSATFTLSAAALGQVPMGQANNNQVDPGEQMRQTMQTIMENMVNKGMDPREFFQQLRDGADPADIEKQLIDKGVIDQRTLEQLHNNVKAMATGNVRDMLGSTDAEWTALEPLISKVMSLASVLDRLTGRPGAGMMSFGGSSGSTATAALSKANRELRAATKDPNTTADSYNSLLKNYRDAREAVRVELESARKDLVGVLTVRQEAVLTDMGILE